MAPIDLCVRATRLSLVLLALSLGFALPAFANHPVLVEGDADFDGDGLLGSDEDLDGDQVFGTLRTALSDAPSAANQNGRVTIVTSGRFAEQVRITGANGNVTLEAAPGVEANVDAVIAGLDGNARRQSVAGIIVDAPTDRRVTIRNIVSRNWTVGILVLGKSHVTIDGCGIENNIEHGILATDESRVAVINTQINASGARISPVAPTDPNPGNGLTAFSSSKVLFGDGTVTGSLGAGIANLTGKKGNVKVQRSNVFDNHPNLVNVKNKD